MQNSKWWRGYPWRNIQTNMRQIDMLDIEADRFVDELLEFDASLVMINVGGIIASYSTKLSEEFQSEYLQGDSLKSIIEACHENKIKVLARMDFSKIREPIYQRHPDWAFRTTSGDIVNYNGDVHTCICGGYQQEYVYKIIDEVLTTFSIDGIFFNMGGFNERDYSYHEYGICHCDNCKQKFKAYYGLDLPKTKEMDDPTYRKYLLFKERVTNEENSRMEKYIKSINSNIAVDLFDYTRVESNTEYKRQLPYYQYSSSSNNRSIRGISSDMIASNCTVDFVGFYYRHIAVSAAQQKLRLYQSLANLGGLDYYLIGRLDNHLDKTGYDAVKEVFSFQKQHETEYFSQPLESIADILLIKSGIWLMKPEERGWVRALTESHMLFDEAQEKQIIDKSLDKYNVVIVPALERLSSAITAQLEEYASRGGTVIIVGESGKYDEQYDMVDLPMGNLLGISRIGYSRYDMVSSMLKRSIDELEQFPSMKNTEVLMLGDDYIYADYLPETKKYLSLIPPHNYGPPERCYFTQITSHPGITVHQIGKGKGVFIPWLPGTLYYREGYENTFFFMKDVLQQFTDARSVGNTLTKMVEVTYAKAKDNSFRLIQLVNTSGHFGTSYMEPLAIRDIKLSIPCCGRIKKAMGLVSKKKVSFSLVENIVNLTIPEITDFECIKIELEGGHE